MWMIDTVHGANTAKIRNYRLDENPYYAELAKVPTYKLRQVMNHLMLNGYLAVTNDEYAIVKLTGKSKGILEEGRAGGHEDGQGSGASCQSVRRKCRKGKKKAGRVAAGLSDRAEQSLRKQTKRCLRSCGRCQDGDCKGRKGAALYGFFR